jgi:hypothetical protein
MRPKWGWKWKIADNQLVTQHPPLRLFLPQSTRNKPTCWLKLTLQLKTNSSNQKSHSSRPMRSKLCRTTSRKTWWTRTSCTPSCRQSNKSRVFSKMINRTPRRSSLPWQCSSKKSWSPSRLRTLRAWAVSVMTKEFMFPQVWTTARNADFKFSSRSLSKKTITKTKLKSRKLSKSWLSKHELSRPPMMISRQGLYENLRNQNYLWFYDFHQSEIPLLINM